MSLLLGESDESRKRWRVARFDAAVPEELVITLGDHVPGTYQDVAVDDVFAAAPVDLQCWIAGVCDRQLALADGFGRQDPRLAPKEAHVRAAATRFAEIAGAEQSQRHASDEFQDAVLEMPDTVDELLDRASGHRRARSAREVACAAAMAWRSPALTDVIASLTTFRRRSQAESERQIAMPAARTRAAPAARSFPTPAPAIALSQGTDTSAQLTTFITMLIAALLTATAMSMVQGVGYGWLSFGAGSALVGALLRNIVRGQRSFSAATPTPGWATRSTRSLTAVTTAFALTAFAAGSVLALSHVESAAHTNPTPDLAAAPHHLLVLTGLHAATLGRRNATPAKRTTAAERTYSEVITTAAGESDVMVLADGSVLLSHTDTGGVSARYIALPAATHPQAKRDARTWLEVANRPGRDCERQASDQAGRQPRDQQARQSDRLGAADRPRLC